MKKNVTVNRLIQKNRTPLLMNKPMCKRPLAIGKLYRIFFFFFSATPVAYGSFQARGQIRAAAGLHHSNARFEPCLQPTPQFIATADA